ncbi:coiled-coil domain-containing protein 42 homolog isoform X2 [Melanotaenia boesemani]|uniref:coiled-coil domain-containing protein 42 homolog isoform X2 n=1 Tax=Melanotaenia boesemani TaxID=1250792 RepID=UPI001C04CA68|nr:coiled-coil domain-containing protein 42 homolog isoform X2 [Melanotaenia boesemani]
MTTSSLPIFHRDSGPKPKVEKAMQNIFVTQPEETRQRKEDIDSYISTVPRTSRILEAGVNTLKKTMVVRKRAELDEVDTLLALKRQQFKSCMEDLAHRRSELEKQQQQDKERVKKFEKFVAENEVKRHRALKKCDTTREQNVLKQREIEDLTEQLKQLRVRKERLKERMVKNKIFEDFLMRTLDYLPSIYRNNGNESLVMPIIWRHETLSITHQELLKRLEQMEAEVEQSQQLLRSMKPEHNIKTLMANKELSELQSELETLKEKNKQAEVNLLMEQGVSREKVEEVGRLIMAINNLAQQCYLPAYGPLESMNVLTMLDMVKECILDKADTERRVKRLMGSASAVTSTAAVTDKRWRASMKSFGSKTHIKS